MKITRPLMASVYEMLRTCEPFKGWNLPHESNVVFSRISAKNFYGDYLLRRIRVTSLVKSVPKLVETMAHEMCHMRLELAGRDNGKEHGPEFKRLAVQVCKHLGFDLKEF